MFLWNFIQNGKNKLHMLKYLITAMSLIPMAGFCQSVNPAFIVNDKVNKFYIASANEGLFIFEYDGKYGYMDKNQKVVVPAQLEFPDRNDYRSATKFQNGSVAVKKDSKWMVIDKTGKKVSPDFECIALKDYNLQTKVFVLLKDIYGTPKYGVVNADGKQLVPFDYEEPIVLDSNLIITRKKHMVVDDAMIFSLRDATGKILIPEGETFDYYDNITVNRKEKFIVATDAVYNYLMDLNMNTLLQLPRSFDQKKNYSKEALQQVLGNATPYYTNPQPTGIREMTFISVSKGRIFYRDKYAGRGKIGMLDIKGNPVMDPKYDDLWSGFDKYDMCKISNKGKGLQLFIFGYIDRSGKEIFTPGDETPNFYHDLPAGTAYDIPSKTYGVKDRTGKWVTAPAFDQTMGAVDRYGGFMARLKSDQKWHYMDVTGKDHGTITTSGLSNIFEIDNDGYYCAEVPDSSARVAFEDRTISGPIADCKAFGAFSEGLAIIQTGSTGKLGFIDSTGKVVIPCEYDNISPFVNGISLAGKIVGGKMLGGYIDKKGKVILPLQYEKIGKFQDGNGIVQTEAGFFYVDNTGKLRPAPVSGALYCTEFSSGLAMAVTPGQSNMKTHTYFDKTLTTKLTVNAYEATPFRGEVAFASFSPGIYSIIDRKGAKVKDLPPGIQGLDFFGDGMFGVKYNGFWGFMNEKGDMVISPKYDSAGAFRNGSAKVKKNLRWGVINTNEVRKLEIKYNYVEVGNEGTATYMDSNRKWGAIYYSGIGFYGNLAYATAFMDGKAIIRMGYRYVILRSPLAK
jgi:hypothetical protein